MQKRLTRKLDLELFLSQIKPHPTPNLKLEQYTISTDAAARMLYIAAYTNNDIVDKAVLDLGCGTGRLALGAAFLGAKEVVGVDIDKTAVRLANEYAAETGFNRRIQWIAADLDLIHGDFDVVLQNPPFGIQKRGADRRFLVKALESGRKVYSLHKSMHDNEALVHKLKTSSNQTITVSASPFLKRFVEKNGGNIESVYTMLMTIPHMFDYHTERRHDFLVDLYVIVRK